MVSGVVLLQSNLKTIKDWTSLLQKTFSFTIQIPPTFYSTVLLRLAKTVKNTSSIIVTTISLPEVTQPLYPKRLLEGYRNEAAWALRHWLKHFRQSDNCLWLQDQVAPSGRILPDDCRVFRVRLRPELWRCRNSHPPFRSEKRLKYNFQAVFFCLIVSLKPLRIKESQNHCIFNQI